ncbi:MAG: DUF1269 domain-containing protein [Anaerolineae bacterium]
MGDLLVIVFDDLDEARQARDAVRAVQKEKKLNLDDAAVIVKDASGKVHVDGEVDRGVKFGLGVGTAIGLALMLVFPPAALVIGVVTGGVVGRLAGEHVDKKFVQEVSDALKPGSSALFLIIRADSPADSPEALRAALAPFKGEIYQTNLSPELEEKLSAELSS